MPATQQHRQIAVSSPLGADVLLFGRMTAVERLGRPFEFQVELLSENGGVKPADLLGQGMTVRLALPGGKTRHFHGIVSRFACTGASGKYAKYQAVLRPWLWLLTRTSDCRIWQEKTAPDIIKEVFRDNGFSDFSESLSGTYRTREYCVQYRETDFQFVSRLMEQEGIYYYFKHEDGKHTLVLSDSISAHAKQPGYEQIVFLPPDHRERFDKQYIGEWRLAQEIQSGAWAHTDYDFERPKANLEARSNIQRQHAAADLEMYDYPGDYIQSADGSTYAQVRIQELQAQYEQVEGVGNARGLAAGSLFELIDYPRGDQNREHLVVAATHELVSDEYEAKAAGAPADVPLYRCSFAAISSQQQFRAPRLTPKPLVQGPQTAVVVGPAGEEIWTDKYGRVKVKFHWDRYSKADENSSCWIRVAQVWAGKKWGGMYIPRIGQEVIVDFLEGDPDHPIITGRVYNGEQMPPYTLPDNKTQSIFKSRSSAGGTEETFNELRFEDKKDEEHVYFHAEKDFQRVVENNDALKVGFDKKDKGDRTVEVFNNETITIGADGCDDGSQTVTILKDRTETLKTGNESVTVEQGDRTVTLDQGNDTHQLKQGNREVKIDQGNDTLTITQGDQTITITAGKSTIEAGTAIELKVGGSSIKIEPAKITLKSVEIAVQGDGKLGLKSPMSEVSGDGTLALKGGMIKIN